MKKRTIIDASILLLVLIGGYFAVKNATAIGDWWYFKSFTPSDEVAQLADDAGMSNFGRKLFYRLDPQLVDRQTINDQCGSDALGCTVGRNIYILSDNTPSQYNRSIVTAAHEMLHVGYSRLTKSELEDIRSDLDTQIDQTDDQLLEKFSNFSDEKYYNEAHSYIGTEEPLLSSTLNAYYQKYFDNRDKILKALKASPEN